MSPPSRVTARLNLPTGVFPCFPSSVSSSARRLRDSFLFDAQTTGPAITHFAQVPLGFWVSLTVAIGAAEQKRATIGWVEPENVPVGKAGLLRDDYLPGSLGFDPLGLKPSDPTEFFEMQTKELQNGRLPMLAAADWLLGSRARRRKGNL
jgi:hypothetical protein